MTGKKLMILGGTIYACKVVEICKELGVRTVVLDYNIQSPAKKIADVSYLVDIKDVDKVVEIGKKENVDGVLFTVLDFIFEQYVDVCSKLNLPCYGTKKQFDILQNKDKFKQLCIANDVHVIPDFVVDGDIDLENIDFPVIVKPVDGSASRGINVCNNYEQLEEGIKEARRYSESNKRRAGIIVERYMQCKDFIAHYVIDNGTVNLVLTGDRFITNVEDNKGSVTSAVIYPSIYTKNFISSSHINICKMINKLDIKNGVLFIQMFKDGDRFMCYDPGFRTGGAEVFYFSETVHGYNQLEMMINFALTGKMSPRKSINSEDYFLKGKIACCMTLLLNKGKIKSISGLDKIAEINQVINITQFYYEGDTVKEIASLAQTLARVHIIADNESELAHVIQMVEEYVVVLDTDGNNMLIPPFDIINLLNR